MRGYSIGRHGVFKKNFINHTIIGNCDRYFISRGVRPFFSDKYDITKYKNYRLLEDYDKKNKFDLEKYIKRKGNVKLNRETVITKFCFLTML